MKFFAYLVMALLLVPALGACCSPSSEVGAEKARSLSQAELEELYLFIEERKDQFIEWGGGGEPVPENLEQMGAIYGDVGRLDRLVFGGCIDDKASLSFEGFRGYGRRQIVLIPGEQKQPEVLWSDETGEH